VSTINCASYFRTGAYPCSANTQKACTSNTSVLNFLRAWCMILAGLFSGSNSVCHMPEEATGKLNS